MELLGFAPTLCVFCAEWRTKHSAFCRYFKITFILFPFPLLHAVRCNTVCFDYHQNSVFSLVIFDIISLKNAIYKYECSM